MITSKYFEIRDEGININHLKVENAFMHGCGPINGIFHDYFTIIMKDGGKHTFDYSGKHLEHSLKEADVFLDEYKY